MVTVLETKWSKYYGDYAFTPDIDVNKSAYGALKDTAGRHPDRVAVEYGRRKFTYGELISLIDRYASIFAAQGIGRGSNVMISCRRMPHQIISFFALNKIGASAIFVMRNARPEVFGKLGQTLKASHMIFSVDIFNKYKHLFMHTPIRQIILARSSDYSTSADVLNPNIWDLKKNESYDPGQDNAGGGPEVVFWTDLMNGEYPEAEEVSEPDNTAVYFMSGVAAGQVNIVKHSSRSLNSQAMISAFLLGKGVNRVFSFIRMDFSFGMCFAMYTTLVSGNTYLINTQRDLEFSGRDINNYRPDVVIGYPQMISSLIDSRRINTRTMSNIKTICSCGNIMTGSEYHRIKDFFSKKNLAPKIMRIYGITETASVYMFLPEDEIRPSALGIPVPGVRMKIINPDNNGEQMNGTLGVIAVNTPSGMSGYVDADDDTNTVLRRLNDGDIWVISGDLGTEGEDGMFYFGGTRRRLFDRGGMHVYPQLIEDEIRSVLGVDDCCAVPLERDGRTIVKVAVKPDSSILFNNDRLNELKDAIEIMCEMEMPEPMRPDEYEFMAYLPAEKYGRVDYEKIISMFKEEDDEQKDNQNIGSAAGTVDDV